MNTKNKKTLGIILVIALIVALIGSCFLLTNTIKVYNEVIFNDYYWIKSANYEVVSKELDIKDTAKYQETMQTYYDKVKSCLSTNNAISENNMLYKKYIMPNFYNFILDEVSVSTYDNTSIADRKNCIDTITKISKELNKVDILSTSAGMHYNYIGDSQGFSKTVEKIETICKEWK
ncbi:MAG: hypothetical protein RRY52_03815 [Anaerovoracaceae bacterium]